MSLLQSGLCIVEPAARDRQIGGSPERAREAPSVAGPPEDVVSLGKIALGAVIVALDRLDQAQPGEDEPAPAPVAQGGP